MIFPAAIPPGAISSSPCCATAYLYSISGLHYYATKDCATGVTGTGVSGTLMNSPGGCNGTTCAPGSIVNPMRLDSEVAMSLSFLGGPQHPFRRTQSKELLRKLRLDLKFMKSRPAPASNGKDGIANRRKNMAEYLVGAGGVTGELENIDELPDELRDAFFEYVHRELIKVRIDEATSSSRGFVVFDRDLELETMPYGELIQEPSPSSEPTIVVYKISPNVVVSDAMFKTNGAADPQTPFVQLKSRRVGQDAAEDQNVYFRIQKVVREAVNPTDPPAFTHYVGQQIGEAHLKWGAGGGVVAANKIDDAKWIDRHSHFHVIEATPVGETVQQILVYSSLDLAAKEQFT